MCLPPAFLSGTCLSSQNQDGKEVIKYPGKKHGIQDRRTGFKFSSYLAASAMGQLSALLAPFPHL